MPTTRLLLLIASAALTLTPATRVTADAPAATQPAADCCALPSKAGAVADAECCAAMAAADPATQPADASAQTAAQPAAKPAGPAAPSAEAAALFEKVKSLVGKWEGDAGGQTVAYEYSLTGGGTTVVETMNLHGGMMTLYTLDKDRVVITHYCGAGNQPRMASTGLTANKATFAFLDATGMKSDKDVHMHGMSLTFGDDGSVQQDWSMHAEGKPAGVVTIRLKKAV